MATNQQRPENILPRELPFTFMREITMDFSSEKLGESVFGTVYKGVLPEEGRVLAVKRLNENAPVPPGTTFDNEVANLMELRHENIVRLLHFCQESMKKVLQHNGRYVIVDVVESLLCYEYLPKGTLDKYIYDGNSTIDWETRFKIIKGICQGLHFLHKEQGRPLVHMNLMPASIWLDDNWVPKIADFYFSRIFGEDQTRAQTVNVKGHIGYMSPEYLYRGEISTRLDIYSLGMIILEITTGEKNKSDSSDRSARQFVDKVHQHWRKYDQIIYKYPRIDESGFQQVKACISIGLKCVEVDRNKRPSIADVVDRLNGKHVQIFEFE